MGKKVIFGQLGRLKPEKIEEYEALHAAPWPGVLQTIHDCNLRNYSIFRHEDLVFAYFEYVGENYDADMEKMAQDPVTQEWWTHTKPCFIKYSIKPDSEFYADMKQIFCLNNAGRRTGEMYTFSIMPLDEEHVEEYCLDIINQVKDGVAMMPLFLMTLTPEGNPVIDKASLYCSVYKKYKDRLDAEGVPSGVLIQASIGHGWKVNEASLFQKYVGLKDGSSRDGVHCPLDPGFRKYIRAAAATIAAAGPNHIMLDDDFRLIPRPQKGCACPMHMAEFNRLAGTDMSRAELYSALCKGDDRAAQYRTLYIKSQIDSLVSCAKEIRAGIDSVDPSIPGSFCGTDSPECAYEVALIMAGRNHPITIRIGNSSFSEKNHRHFSHVMHRAATQIAALNGMPDVILAETDTCPQNRYSSSAVRLHAHFTFSILEGIRGAKHWITRTVAFELASGKAFRQKLRKYNGFYSELAKISEDATWLGCKIPIPPRPMFCLTENDQKPYENNGWYGHVLDRLGLPMHFSSRGEGACFFDGRCDEYFTDKELETILAGNVILDATAAERVIARGFGRYLGVELKQRQSDAPNASGEIMYPSGKSRAMPKLRQIVTLSNDVKHYSEAYHLRDGVHKDILFPSVTAYRNELGGTAVVFAGDTSFEYSSNDSYGFLNESRKAQLVQILNDLDSLPVYYPEDAEMLMKAAKLKDGRLMCAVLNMSLDPVEELPLVIRQKVKSIHSLTCTGAYEEVPFTNVGDLYTLSVTAHTFDPLILLIES